MTAGVEQRAARATPVRSLMEIVVLALYLVAVPPLLETAMAAAGYPTTGVTRIVATAALFAGVVALVVVLLATRGETVLDIGLRAPSSAAATVLIGLALAAAIFLGLEELKRAGIMDESRLGNMASELKGDLTLALARAALSVFVVAFTEELLFRGFVLDRIVKAFGGVSWALPFAVLGQAILFGLTHAYQGTQGMLFTGAIGLLFGVVVLAAGRNLWPVIVAHATYDAGRAAYFYLT